MLNADCCRQRDPAHELDQSLDYTHPYTRSQLAVTDGSRCPQCGGSVQLQEEDSFVRCPFCGSLLQLGAASSNLLLQPAIDARELTTRLTKWLDDREALGKPEKVTTRLLYFPFWTVPDGSRTMMVPAAPLLVLDIEHFALPSGDLKSYQKESLGTADSVAATVLPEAAVPEAKVKEARLLHLPFWEVSFTLWKRSYRIWIDAASGQVLAFELPVTSESRLDWTYGLLLFVMYALLLFAFHRVFSPGPKIIAILLLVVTAPIGVFLSRQLISLSEKV